MKQQKSLFFVLALLYSFVSQAWSADGDLDLSFGVNGKVVSAAGSMGYAVAIQPDDKLLIAGSSGTGAGVVRFNSDGSLDTAFGSGGAATTVAGIAYSVAVQANGKIVITGRTSGSNGFIARFNSNGTLDTTFAGSGSLVGGNVPAYPRSIIQQTDGKLVIAGQAPFSLVRLNSNGTYDTTFDGDGVVANPFASTNSGAFQVIQQSDGKLVVAGYKPENSNYDTTLVRYLGNGVLDAGFGTGGVATYPAAGTYDNAFSVIQQPDGKLVLAGYDFSSAINGIFIRRVSSTGAPDSSFGSGGLTKVSLNISSACSCDQLRMIQQSDGKIVIADSRYGNEDYLVIRLTPDGIMDNTFSNDGIVIESIGTADNSVGVVQQSSGKLVVGGDSNGTPAGMSMLRLQVGGPDADNDGFGDAIDNCPAVSNTSQTNTDGMADGGDACDDDDDNDGALDVNDAFPLDAFESVDTDNDGTGNNTDPDDDGDGYVDGLDAYPLNPYKWKFPSCDFDGDSDSDILVRDLVTKLWKIFKVQSAVVTSNTTIGIPDDVYTQHMAALDSDGDGDKDILTRHSNTGLWTLYEIDNGNTVAAHSLLLYASADWNIVATGDFNGDAVDDVLLRDSVGGSYRTFLLGHHGVVQVKHFNGWLSSQSVDQGVGDFDGDGTDDLLVRRTSDNLYFIFKVDNGDVVSRTCVCNLWKNPDWTFQFASDMNADGTSDIVIRGTGPSADGKWWRFQMNNRAATNTAYFNLFHHKDRVKLGAVGDYNGDGTNDVILRVDDATSYVAPVANGLATGHGRIGNFGTGEAIEQ